MAPKHQAIKPHALKVPGLIKLSGKRVVLASASPRRKEILATFVRMVHLLFDLYDETNNLRLLLVLSSLLPLYERSVLWIYARQWTCA